MTATRDALVSARVPRDLREDLERLAAADNVDLSIIARRALREYADRMFGRPVNLTGTGGLWAGGAGAHHRRAGPAEIAAALKVAPRLGSQRRTVLDLYEAAGARGLTADEVVAALPHYAANGLPRRVTDLLQGGLIGERSASVLAALAPDEEVLGGLPGIVTRRTRAGAHATVYAIARRGRLELEAARDRERQAAA